MKDKRTYMLKKILYSHRNRHSGQAVGAIRNPSWFLHVDRWIPGLRYRFARNDGVFLLCLFLLSIVALPTHAAKTEQPLPPFQLMLEDVESAVSQALTDAQIANAEHIRATVTSTRKPLLYADHQPVEVELTTLTHQEQSKSWSANMVIVKNEEVVTAQPIAGRYEPQKPLPVLKRRLKNGQVITEQDVEMRLFPVTKVRKTTVTDINQLIGKTPQRTISSNRPLRSSELVSPKVMEAGATVHMRYHTPFMQISTVGEALEEGGIGDVIRIRNLDSKKVVHARIMSSDEVRAGVGSR